jgi:PAS domain S-box-containing protein
VLIFDASGTLIDCNEAFLKRTGFNREDVDAKKLNWRSMTPPEFIPSGEEQLQKLAETGRIAPYEKEYYLKSGEREWMVFAGASLGDGTKVEYCMDISGRKRAEREVRESGEKLRISNEALQRANDDLKHFSYALSHDLQEPLRMVTSYTQLLDRNYSDKLDAEAHRFMGYAVQGAQRMEALLNDLREYWSMDHGSPHELTLVDCNAVLKDAFANLEAGIKESGASVKHGVLPTVRAEKVPLTLLFQNLISNAVKYRRPDVPPRIQLSADLLPGEKGRREWKFTVADNGIGIEKENLQGIFAPFERLHGTDAEGTGLGLALCRKVIERHGGRIWAESGGLGQGTTFYFTLPAGSDV